MDTSDHLRSFGMSGMMITDELKNIEKSLDIELGHLPPAIKQSALEYYPQFEKEVRNQATAMAQYYEMFYCLEQSIRKLITETMEEAAGADWWDSKVPQQIRENVRRLLKDEIDNGITQRSERSIDYTTFGELGVIISSNWEFFEPVLTSQLAVQRIIKSLNLLRGPIAHCCPMSEDEVDRLALAVKDWFRLIG
ncbi:MAG: Swt1 family HEPN domain-containing protein [Pseudolabrys sp.]|nr:Swt1 family HEPN domain-containing protein [Pseudolabrys sp.]